MTATHFEQWHQQLLQAATEQYGISGEELDEFAAHILEQQYYDELLTPEKALKRVMQGYPPIS